MASVRKSRKGPTKLGADLRKRGKVWLDRVEAAGKKEKNWLDDAKKATDAYTNEGVAEAYGTTVIDNGGYDFNILFSNVETIVPAVINSSPVPDIRRRFQDEDPVARVVSDLLERAIRVQIDDSRLQTELEATAQDAFLAGRGVMRLRFYSDIVETLPTNEELEDAAEPETGSSDEGAYSERDGEVLDEDAGAELVGRPDQIGGEPAIGHNGGPPLEHLENERICFEAVSWIDYRHGPAKRWDDRPWEAFRFCIPQEDEDKSFDAALIGEQLDDSEINGRKDKCEDGINGWEIWDSTSRKVIFIDDQGVILKMVDDPLGLSGFFCTATPIQPITVNGRLMPVNPFSVYRRLALDLDDAVRRKNKLINAMKVRGWYGISETDMQGIQELADNEFRPITNPEIWAANGGLKGAIAFWPLEMFIAAIQQLDAAIDRYKAWIYEITGISDIVRGASVASETATAQNIKSQWGSLRIQKMQRMMERCARDLFVMMSEIIPSKFSLETLQQMTGIQIIVAPNDPPEEVQKKLAIQALLKKKLATYYRVDVESDSTVRADLTRQKQEVAEFLQGAGAYFAAVAPLVQQGALPAEAAVEIFAATARMFSLGKSVEDTLEQMVTRAKQMAQQAAQQPQGQQEDPAQQAAAAKMQADAQSAQITMQAKQQDMQIKAQQSQFDMQRQQGEFQAKMQEAARKAEADGLKAQRDAVIAEMDLAMKQIELQIKQVELATKQNQPAESGEAHKPPSESISFKDLPPEGQAQMAAQAGIILSPQQMADHQTALDAKKAAMKPQKPMETA